MQVNMIDREWVCNHCGSGKIMEKAWISLNHEAKIDDDLYVKYVDCCDDRYWCDKCQEETTPMPYENYMEKEDG